MDFFSGFFCSQFSGRIFLLQIFSPVQGLSFFYYYYNYYYKIHIIAKIRHILPLWLVLMRSRVKLFFKRMWLFSQVLHCPMSSIDHPDMRSLVLKFSCIIHSIKYLVVQIVIYYNQFYGSYVQKRFLIIKYKVIHWHISQKNVKPH